MRNVCVECGGAVQRDWHAFDVRVGRRTVSVSGDYDRCVGECGEFYFAPGEMNAAMLRASDVIRAEEQLLTPSEIKSLRHRVGLTQSQLETLLGAGAKTVVRWEKGTVIQNGATDTLLRLLRDVPAALQHLMNEKGIASNVVPLVPIAKTVSYRYQCEASSPVRSVGTMPLRVHESVRDKDVSPVLTVERVA